MSVIGRGGKGAQSGRHENLRSSSHSTWANRHSPRNAITSSSSYTFHAWPCATAIEQNGHDSGRGVPSISCLPAVLPFSLDLAWAVDPDPGLEPEDPPDRSAREPEPSRAGNDVGRS